MQATLLDAIGRLVGHYTLAATQSVAQVELLTAALAPGLSVVQLLALDKRGSAIGTLPAPRLSIL